MKAMTFILFLSFSLVSFEGDGVKITWSETDKLTWKDFKGRVLASQDYAASSSTGISFSYTIESKEGDFDLDYLVICHFYPEDSWYDRSLASPYILQHEQTHFDISELHARILRKLISEASFSKRIKIEIKAIYKEIERQRVAMQERFDLETEHSINRENEYLWEHFVANKLKEYERWK